MNEHQTYSTSVILISIQEILLLLLLLFLADSTSVILADQCPNTLLLLLLTAAAAANCCWLLLFLAFAEQGGIGYIKPCLLKSIKNHGLCGVPLTAAAVVAFLCKQSSIDLFQDNNVLLCFLYIT